MFCLQGNGFRGPITLQIAFWFLVHFTVLGQTENRHEAAGTEKESGQHDMLRSRLDQNLDMGHEKIILVDKIDWCFLSEKMGDVYTDGPGQPPLATRLMAGLHILKHADNLSDDEICSHWLEIPYYQYFCGE